MLCLQISLHAFLQFTEVKNEGPTAVEEAKRGDGNRYTRKRQYGLENGKRTTDGLIEKKR